jgi:hypothetical protein
MTTPENPFAVVLSSLPAAVPKREEIQQLPKFNVVIEGPLTKILEEIIAIDMRARDAKIITRADFDAKAADVKRRKELVKEAEEICDKYKQPLRKYVDIVQQAYNVIKNRAEQVKGIIDPKLEAWKRADDARAANEKKQLQEQVDRQNAAAAKATKDLAAAELKRQFKAGEIDKKTRDIGLQKLGAEYEEALAHPPEVEIEKTKTGGRTYYHAKCVDRLAFIKEFVARYSKGDMSMLRFIVVSDSELDAIAADLRDTDKMKSLFPGIEASNSTSF